MDWTVTAVRKCGPGLYGRLEENVERSGADSLSFSCYFRWGPEICFTSEDLFFLSAFVTESRELFLMVEHAFSYGDALPRETPPETD